MMGPKTVEEVAEVLIGIAAPYVNTKNQYSFHNFLAPKATIATDH